MLNGEKVEHAFQTLVQTPAGLGVGGHQFCRKAEAVSSVYLLQVRAFFRT